MKKFLNPDGMQALVCEGCGDPCNHRGYTQCSKFDTEECVGGQTDEDGDDRCCHGGTCRPLTAVDVAAGRLKGDGEHFTDLTEVDDV